MNIEDVLAGMETLLGRSGTCWGIRRTSGVIEAFYHPDGCETEIAWSPGSDFFVFLKRVEEDREKARR